MLTKEEKLELKNLDLEVGNAQVQIENLQLKIRVNRILFQSKVEEICKNHGHKVEDLEMLDIEKGVITFKEKQENKKEEKKKK